MNWLFSKKLKIENWVFCGSVLIRHGCILLQSHMQKHGFLSERFSHLQKDSSLYSFFFFLIKLSENFYNNHRPILNRDLLRHSFFWPLRLKTGWLKQFSLSSQILISGAQVFLRRTGSNVIVYSHRDFNKRGGYFRRILSSWIEICSSWQNQLTIGPGNNFPVLSIFLNLIFLVFEYNFSYRSWCWYIQRCIKTNWRKLQKSSWHHLQSHFLPHCWAAEAYKWHLSAVQRIYPRTSWLQLCPSRVRHSGKSMLSSSLCDISPLKNVQCTCRSRATPTCTVKINLICKRLQTTEIKLKSGTF